MVSPGSRNSTAEKWSVEKLQMGPAIIGLPLGPEISVSSMYPEGVVPWSNWGQYLLAENESKYKMVLETIGSIMLYESGI